MNWACWAYKEQAHGTSHQSPVPKKVGTEKMGELSSSGCGVTGQDTVGTGFCLAIRKKDHHVNN